MLAWLTHQRRVDTMRTWVGQSIQRTSESSKGSSPPMKIALSICYRVSGRTDLFVRNVRASPSLAFPLGTSSDVGPVGSSSIRWRGQSCIVRTSRFKNGFGRRTWLLRTRLELAHGNFSASSVSAVMIRRGTCSIAFAKAWSMKTALDCTG